MTSKAQKQNGYLLPEIIEPTETVCISFEIPDTDEYRLATRGAVYELANWWNWHKTYVPGDTNASDAANLFLKFLNQTYNEECIMNCDDVVNCIESDANYIGLNSTIFSQSQLNTQQYAQTLNDQYDGSPQSVAPLVPTGSPDASEQNALCYAINAFMQLYASTKLGLLQQANVVQISWSVIRAAQVASFNALIDRLAPVYDVDIFLCWPDDLTAMVALQNDTAIEQVACCLHDELDNVTMSKTAFDSAITACAMSLTGTSGDIACVLSNDNSLDVYLMFLSVYNIALQRQIDGDTLDCPCAGGVWCYDFDWLTSQGVAIACTSNNAVTQWSSGVGYYGSGSFADRVAVRIPFTATITSVSFVWKQTASVPSLNRIYTEMPNCTLANPFYGATSVTPLGGDLYRSNFTQVPLSIVNGLLIYMETANNTYSFEIQSLHLEGVGSNPFGIDNC